MVEDSRGAEENNITKETINHAATAKKTLPKADADQAKLKAIAHKLKDKVTHKAEDVAQEKVHNSKVVLKTEDAVKDKTHKEVPAIRAGKTITEDATKGKTRKGIPENKATKNALPPSRSESILIYYKV